MNVQRYARIAGVLFLLSMVAGGFGEAYVPSKLIVSADATATAANLRNFDFLYRLGFASFLIESLCDTALALILYVLLKPVKAFTQANNLANDDDSGSAHSNSFGLESNRTERAGNGLLAVVSAPANDSRRCFCRAS